MRNVIIHHHIYKNAGSTISYILQKNFGAGFSSLHDGNADGVVTKDSLLTFLDSRVDMKAITSHHFHTRCFVPYSAGDFSGNVTLIDLVLIRHPIVRLVSMYNFLCRGGGGNSEKTEQAARLGLRNWLDTLLETQPNAVNDVQVGVLSRLGYYASPPSVRDLEIAQGKLLDFALVGTVEAFDRFCVCAEYFLQPAFGQLDFSYEIQNAHAPHRRPHALSWIESQIGPSLFSELVRLNSLDIELWETAGLELDRRLTSVYRYAARLESFRARITHPERESLDDEPRRMRTPQRTKGINALTSVR